MKIRTVVTGHDPQGKTCVCTDREVEATTVPLMPGYGFHMLWSTADVPVFPDDGSPAPCPTYFPPVGGSRFLMFTIPAQRTAPPAGTDLAQAADQTRQALPGLLEVMEPDAPGMHRSNTIDYVFVLEGEIVLELDNGRETTLRTGDVAVQNGTRHAWRNRSGKPVRMLVCMAGARHTD